jgi:hypothetical protein
LDGIEPENILHVELLLRIKAPMEPKPDSDITRLIEGWHIG